jgi:hypothetical protein
MEKKPEGLGLAWYATRFAVPPLVGCITGVTGTKMGALAASLVTDSPGGVRTFAILGGALATYSLVEAFEKVCVKMSSWPEVWRYAAFGSAVAMGGHMGIIAEGYHLKLFGQSSAAQVPECKR